MSGCIFVKNGLKAVPQDQTAIEMIETFCKGDNTSCARNMIAGMLSPADVPTDMTPTDANWAQEIIAECE
jgi:hypothetical protein